MISVGLLVYAYRILKNKLSNEMTMVRNLAAKNGWKYESALDAQRFVSIADYIGFDPGVVHILYFVSVGQVGVTPRLAKPGADSVQLVVQKEEV